MDSLQAINEEQGITVITNLHTLDTARTYCERIIGMSAGRVVFDGTPEELTTEVARQLYGADGLEEAFSEEMTSTSLEGIAPRKKKKKHVDMPGGAMQPTLATASLPN
jgi:phosphonate transport system ATP-binding protein